MGDDMDLQSIRESLNKITPYPWLLRCEEHCDSKGYLYLDASIDGGKEFECTIATGVVTEDAPLADMEFLANAPETIALLLAQLTAANARIAELEAQVAHAARLQVEMSGTDPLYPLHLLAHDERHQRNINAFLDGVQP